MVHEVEHPRHGPEVLDERDLGEPEPVLGLVVHAEIGAPEPVDRLFGVTDHDERTGVDRDLLPVEPTGIRFARGEQHRELDLERIGVLELIEQDAAPPPRRGFTHRRVGTEQVAGEDEQVVELERALAPPLCRVGAHEVHHSPEQRVEDRASLRLDDRGPQRFGVSRRGPRLRDIAGPVALLPLLATRDLRGVGQPLQPVEPVDGSGEACPVGRQLVDVDTEPVVGRGAPRAPELGEVVERVEQGGDVDRGRDLGRERGTHAVDVVMEQLRDVAEVVEAQPEHQAHQQGVVEARVVVEVVEELAPPLLERDAWRWMSSSTSKPGGRPASSGCSVRSRWANPCRVVRPASSSWSSASLHRCRASASSTPTVSPADRACSSAPRIRSRSSAAAASVNVIAASSRSSMRPEATSATTRSTSAVVLPVPAPASTNRLTSWSSRTAVRAVWSTGGPHRSTSSPESGSSSTSYARSWNVSYPGAVRLALPDGPPVRRDKGRRSRSGDSSRASRVESASRRSARPGSPGSTPVRPRQR